jgi:hypothetical protein
VSKRACTSVTVGREVFFDILWHGEVGFVVTVAEPCEYLAGPFIVSISVEKAVAYGVPLVFVPVKHLVGAEPFGRRSCLVTLARQFARSGVELTHLLECAFGSLALPVFREYFGVPVESA